MHLMFLGVVKSAVSCLIMVAKMFDVDKSLLKSIVIKIGSLTKSGIDSIPKETIKDDKTAGWIVADFVPLARGMPWVLKGMDNLLEIIFKETKT